MTSCRSVCDDVAGEVLAVPRVVQAQPRRRRPDPHRRARRRSRGCCPAGHPHGAGAPGRAGRGTARQSAPIRPTALDGSTSRSPNRRAGRSAPLLPLRRSSAADVRRGQRHFGQRRGKRGGGQCVGTGPRNRCRAPLPLRPDHQTSDRHPQLSPTLASANATIAPEGSSHPTDATRRGRRVTLPLPASVRRSMAAPGACPCPLRACRAIGGERRHGPRRASWSARTTPCPAPGTRAPSSPRWSSSASGHGCGRWPAAKRRSPTSATSAST